MSEPVGLNKILFTHRNHKLNKQVQETQKQYAYLSVTYIQNDNHTDTYDSKMANYCQSRFDGVTKQQNNRPYRLWFCGASMSVAGHYAEESLDRAV